MAFSHNMVAQFPTSTVLLMFDHWWMLVVVHTNIIYVWYSDDSTLKDGKSGHSVGKRHVPLNSFHGSPFTPPPFGKLNENNSKN